MTDTSNAPAVDAVKVAATVRHDAVLRRAQEIVDHLRRTEGQHFGIEHHKIEAAAELGAQAMQAAMAKALAAQAPGAVKVRELVWVQDGGDGFRSFHADSGLGRFAYGTDRDGLHWQTTPTGCTEHATEDAARMAAEASYFRLMQEKAREIGIQSALTAAPPVAREAATEIVMGRGLVDVGDIHHEGRSGILFRPRSNHIPVGELGEVAGKYWPVSGDVVIWIENKGGAEVIHDFLAPFLATPAPSQQPAGEAGGLVERAHIAVECVTRQLADVNWRPLRSNIEGKRNLIRDLGARIEADAAHIAELEAENAGLRGDVAAYEKTMAAIEQADRQDQAKISALEGEVAGLKSEREEIEKLRDGICKLVKGDTWVTCGESIVAQYLAQDYRWDYQATAEARSLSIALWRYWHDQQKARADELADKGTLQALRDANDRAEAAEARATKAEADVARLTEALAAIAEHPGPNADDAAWCRVDDARAALAQNVEGEGNG